MNIRKILGVAAAAAVIVGVGLNFKPKPPGGGVPPAQSSIPPPVALVPADPEATPRAKNPPDVPPTPGEEKQDIAAEVAALEIVSFTLSRPGGEPLAEVRRNAGVWSVASLYGAAADSVRVGDFVRDVRDAGYVRAPDDVRADPSVAGLGDGQGIEIVLNPGENAVALVVGDGIDGFSRTYVRKANEVFVATADLRGDLGLWGNRAVPDPSFWLERKPLTAPPGDLARIDFESPGQSVHFVRDDMDGWRCEGEDGPLTLDGDRLDAWIRDFSAFTVVGVADPGRYAETGLGRPTHSLSLDFGEGNIVSIAGAAGRDGACHVEFSSRPGIPYVVPVWRFNLYFNRLADIFPGAAPGLKASKTLP